MQKANKVKIGVIILNIISGLIFIWSILVWPFIFMSFYDPGSQNFIRVGLIPLIIISFPLWNIISTIFSWVFYNKQQYGLAFVSAGLPIFAVVVFVFGGDVRHLIEYLYYT